MHMADALISAPVGLTMAGITVVTLGYSIHRTASEEDEHLAVKMGVLSALVFAGQMINFTIPGTGASGHICGAVLLSALLGPFPAFLSMASIILIQALFFADGGLLAWGCNVFNMGFWGCFVGYPLILKPLIKNHVTSGRLIGGSILAAVISLQLGALGVVFQTLISGVTTMSLQTFLWFMLPIHLAIGVGEGIITGLTLHFLFAARPELLENTQSDRGQLDRKSGFVLLGLACVTAGGLSLLASSNPDGLEWSMAESQLAVNGGGSIHQFFENIQETLSFLPDYSFGSGSPAGTIVSGLVGVAFLVGISLLIKYFRKDKQHGSV